MQRAAIDSFQDPEDVGYFVTAAGGRPPPADDRPFPYISLGQPDLQAEPLRTPVSR